MADNPEMGGREKYRRLIAAAQKEQTIKVAVAHPCDDVSLRGAVEAAKLRLIEPILVGPVAHIRRAAQESGLDIGQFELIDAEHSHGSAAKAVELRSAQSLLFFCTLGWTNHELRLSLGCGGV